MVGVFLVGLDEGEDGGSAGRAGLEGAETFLQALGRGGALDGDDGAEREVAEGGGEIHFVLCGGEGCFVIGGSEMGAELGGELGCDGVEISFGHFGKRGPAEAFDAEEAGAHGNAGLVGERGRVEIGEDEGTGDGPFPGLGGAVEDEAVGWVEAESAGELHAVGPWAISSPSSQEGDCRARARSPLADLP